MGIDKFRRKVVGDKAEFKEQIVCIKGTLVNTGVTAGEMYSKANPLGVDVIVIKTVVDITTVTSATPVTFDCGCAAANAATSNDNLLDGVVIGTPTAIAIYDNITNKGTNGLPTRKWASDKFLTITASGTPTGLAGSIYIWYRKA